MVRFRLQRWRGLCRVVRPKQLPLGWVQGGRCESVYLQTLSCTSKHRPILVIKPNHCAWNKTPEKYGFTWNCCIPGTGQIARTYPSLLFIIRKLSQIQGTAVAAFRVSYRVEKQGVPLNIYDSLIEVPSNPCCWCRGERSIRACCLPFSILQLQHTAVFVYKNLRCFVVMDVGSVEYIGILHFMSYAGVCT